MDGQTSPIGPDDLSPFTPSSGGPPPYLAGRRNEQEALRRGLRHLERASRPPTDIILYGPRGNGKTVLLNWLRNQAEQGSCDTLWLTPAVLSSAGDMAKRLAGPALPKIGTFRFKGLSWKRQPAAPESVLPDLLRKRCAKRPLLILFDEAHTVRKVPDLAWLLFNAIQEARTGGASLLFVLAGTPDLADALGSIDASFWDRGQQIGVDLLPDGEAEPALTVPFGERGLTFAPHALADVVEDSQRYPFFLQLWGDKLWTTLQEMGSACIERSHVEAARKAVNEARGAYYGTRLAEMQKEGLLKAAGALAQAFKGQPTLPGHKVEVALRGALPRKAQTDAAAHAARNSLAHKGFVWQTPADSAANCFRPGIPNLMGHVASVCGRASAD